MDMKHLEYLQTIADHDVRHIKNKESTYKGSWKKRGGIGAFMMMARKWDRLENMLESGQAKRPNAEGNPHLSDKINCPPFDVFFYIGVDPSGDDGSALAEVRDLRHYLLLVESEMMARGVVPTPPVPRRDIPTNPRPEFGKLDNHGPGTPEDGGHHARDQAEFSEEYEEARLKYSTEFDPGQ